MKSFNLQIRHARSLMKAGEYRRAFELIVDENVHTLPELLGKIECLVDIGFILRDEKILRYSIYLLEKHGAEVLEIPELGAAYFLNLAQQYANLLTLSSFGNDYYGFFERAEQLQARQYYEKVLSYADLPDSLACEAHGGLGQIYQASGRGCEALVEYQKALKINPRNRRILHEKIKLMKEYALVSMPNTLEFLQEARILLQNSMTLRDEGEDDQEDIILRTKLLDGEDNPQKLDEDGEYPVRSVVFESDEEERYSNFCSRNRLYLNICSFCRKCEFALGDSIRLSSSRLTIRQGQKNRFLILRKKYGLLSEKYASGRYIMFDGIHQHENKPFLQRSFFEGQGMDKHHPGYHQLCTAFMAAWSLWDLVALYICVFQDMEAEQDMASLFYQDGKIRHIWKECKSPALHAVFEVYADITEGKDKELSYIARKIKGNDWDEISWEYLKVHCLSLYYYMNFVIQYLGILHERNEFEEKDWDFPRPLYNFVSIT